MLPIWQIFEEDEVSKPPDLGIYTLFCKGWKISIWNHWWSVSLRRPDLVLHTLKQFFENM